MRTKNLILLLIVAVVVCGGAVALYYGQNAARTRARGEAETRGLGDPLLPEIAEHIDAVERIEFTRDDETIILRRGDDEIWVADNVGDYPVLSSKIQKLVADLTDLKVGDRITDKPEKYPNFGLESNETASAVVRFLDADGAVLAELIVGDRRESGMEDADPMQPPRSSGRYVRTGDDPAVYLAMETVSSLTTNVSDWAERQILAIPAADVMRMSVDHGSTESFQVDWTPASPELEPMPEDMQARSGELSTLRGSLSNVNMTGLHQADEATSVTWGATAEVRTRDGLRYVLRRADLDGTDCLSVEVEAAEPLLSASDRASTTTTASVMERASATKENLPALAEKHAGWLYEVSSWSLDRIMKKRSDLIEETPAPPAEAEEAESEPE